MAKKKKELITTLFAVFLISVLILSETAAGVFIGIDAPDTEPEERTSVSFTVFVDIETNEIIPVDNLVLNIGAETCTFMLNGSKISGPLCDDITIEKNHDYQSGYGYMHGFDHEQNINHNFGYGYGYGYENSIAQGAYPYGELSYKITWNTPGVSSDRSFDVSLTANAQDKQFSKNFLDLITVKDTGVNQVVTPAAGSGTTISGAYSDNTLNQAWEFAQIRPGRPVGTIFSGIDLGVSRIELFANELMKNVKLHVTKFDGRPPSIIPGIYAKNIFSYFMITLSEEENLEKARITFTIDKYWLEQLNYDKNDIVLLRYVNGAWVELETTLVGNYLDTYEYEAITPGFSFFASAVKQSAQEMIKEPNSGFEVNTDMNSMTGHVIKNVDSNDSLFVILEMLALLILLVFVFVMIGKLVNN